MEKIAVVVVTYNNMVMLNDLLVNLHKQTRPLDEIVVVDNSITESTGDMIGAKYPNITYIKLKENQGSAGGYHEGLKAALRKNEFIWTLDDDIKIEDDSLEKLIIELESLNYLNNIGAIRSGGSYDSEGVPKEMEFYTWRGTLFNCEALRRIGLPKKKYFIYGEDLEHSIRLKKNGFALFWAPSSFIQEIRDGKTNKSFFRINSGIYIDPFRFYYAFRNEIYIYLRHWHLVKFLRTFLYAFKVLLYITIFDRTNCSKKIYAITLGLLDGFRGRLGKNNKF